MCIIDLIKEAMNGSDRSLAKVISLVENEAEGMQKVLKAVYPRTGKARVIGVTGPPGAGKSTLIGRLAERYLERKHSVGILAIDPSSPISGGSLLGDRIRMSYLPPSGDIFIRSLSSRGVLGGISQATRNVVRVLDASGRDTIIIETVGIGQDEVDVVHVADTAILVLAPGFGDEIQTLKAGVMEVADIFVVNKTDQLDAGKYVNTLEKMVQNLSLKRSWRPPIVKTIALQGEGVKSLMEKIDEHRVFLQNDNFFIHQKERRIRREVLRLAEQKIKRELDKFIEQKFDLEAVLKEAEAGQKDPYCIAEELVGNFRKSLRENNL